MAHAKSVPKRKNKRKVRTEVSSQSSSDSGANETSPALSKRQKRQNTTPANVEAPETPHDHNTSNNETSTDPPVFTKRTAVTNPEQAFEDFYLRQATKELANDLDKLRAANDFHGTESIALLVGALRQGTACFGVEERVRVGGACAGPGA
ncbi:hypothetical protein LTR91_009434 [Friedmanniomyces endolithicus]|uniref:Ribosome assembly protein 3 n=1 Tax=Friedmanniomyces endolithicus TaxID=329885 RepID=A0AAN6QTN4_9PEZI|nr:hypothetical protein LTR35_002482 [Friedmanniomyces endolithicus]KAK0295759.1 hypothetical protein LTS00_005499 [Friedmanniomyces endolithicus]KAK0926862.1 hypothetical protein LTR57_003905 [Friedmanniomyces endolithicus]KAK0984445.1 hypothetical protein LTS01_010663 [Friedmanniomyces endolithicus]KAK0988912.1 hypothetical protein LTR91_009434 [Friedmanniomyces endolithicus]